MRIPKYFHSKYFILSRRDTTIVNFQLSIVNSLKLPVVYFKKEK